MIDASLLSDLYVKPAIGDNQKHLALEQYWFYLWFPVLSH